MSLKRPNREKSSIKPGTSEGPAGIYVHIPFCRSKCPYCSFVSYPDMGDESKNNYILALDRQARRLAKHPWSRARKFHSLFIGGGTPTIVNPEKLARFITTCLQAFDFGISSLQAPEVTMEANPNALNRAALGLYRQAGVNRLSIGVQSFADAMLNSIGRTHTARQAVEAFELARAAGFTNLNLDLMYGLPNQRMGDWERSLQQAVALSPEHLSVYELTIEPGTHFGEPGNRQKLALPHEDVTLLMYEHARQVLAECGYRHYEISNYARRGFECVHNINYWENGSYLGLGGGAVSCFSGLRISSEKNPLQFIKMINNNRLPYNAAEFLPLQSRFRETVIMGLRMTEGVSIRRLEKQFGMSPAAHYGATLRKLISLNLVEKVQGRLCLSPKGLLLSNKVMAELV